MAAEEKTETPNRLLRVEEAAEILGLSKTTVYVMSRGADFPTVRRGRSVRIPLQALMRWIERNTDGDGPGATAQPTALLPITPPFYLQQIH
jgi:excisionase family DNA binding protein